jgi:hypothetical protein
MDHCVVLVTASSESLSGNKTFIKQCFGSYTWQS